MEGGLAGQVFAPTATHARNPYRKREVIMQGLQCGSVA